MNEIHEDATVVFDQDAVVRLSGDAGDPAFATVLVDKFRALLPRRVHRIVSTLRAGDPDEALDAALSLKVSACLIGAGELCILGTSIEGHLRRLDLAAARAAAAEITAAAIRADKALDAFVLA